MTFEEKNRERARSILQESGKPIPEDPAELVLRALQTMLERQPVDTMIHIDLEAGKSYIVPLPAGA